MHVSWWWLAAPRSQGHLLCFPLHTHARFSLLHRARLAWSWNCWSTACDRQRRKSSTVAVGPYTKCSFFSIFNIFVKIILYAYEHIYTYTKHTHKYKVYECIYTCTKRTHKYKVYEHIYTYTKHTHKYKVYEYIYTYTKCTHKCKVYEHIYTYTKHTHKYSYYLSNLKLVNNCQTGL